MTFGTGAAAGAAGAAAAAAAVPVSDYHALLSKRKNRSECHFTSQPARKHSYHVTPHGQTPTIGDSATATDNHATVTADTNANADAAVGVSVVAGTTLGTSNAHVKLATKQMISCLGPVTGLVTAATTIADTAAEASRVAPHSRKVSAFVRSANDAADAATSLAKIITEGLASASTITSARLQLTNDALEAARAAAVARLAASPGITPASASTRPSLPGPLPHPSSPASLPLRSSEVGTATSPSPGGTGAHKTHISSTSAGTPRPAISGMDDRIAAMKDVTAALAGLDLPEAERAADAVPPAWASINLFRQKPIDLRLQMQASKVTFIVNKRREQLIAEGFTLRQEKGTSTIQDFLDQTRRARQAGGHNVYASGGSDVNGGVSDWRSAAAGGFNFPGHNVGSIGACRCGGRGLSSCDNRDYSQCGGSSGGAFDRTTGCFGSGREKEMSLLEPWADVTLVYSEALGWLYLHRVTMTAVEKVKHLAATVHCREMGLPAVDESAKSTIEGMASLLNGTPDVVLSMDGAIIKVSGTEQAVREACNAIEAVARSSRRLHTAARWCWRGDTTSDQLRPIYPMDAHDSARLEEAYIGSIQYGTQNACTYGSDGAIYETNFVLMLQRNITSGFIRPIERMVTDREACPLPRCPTENLPLTGFREGSTYSLVAVSLQEAAMVRAAVAHTHFTTDVCKVEHIWNSFLWGHYSQNAKTVGNERMLFHGAGSHVIPQICKNGFDKRLAGSKNGQAYGRGCYFARDASLAARYMGYRCGQMIMAKVLVGEFAVGDHTMERPPTMVAQGDRTYDSTSNHSFSPSIIVTYKDWQAYPMYLITFRPGLGAA